MAHPDDELLGRARAGDRGALEQLLERHQRRVFRFGKKMCGGEEDAEDVLQETLLAAARGIKDFRGGSAISTWLYTIARSFCIKRRRTSKFAPPRMESLDGGAGGLQEVADERRGPEEAASDSQLRRSLDQAISALEPMYREVLVLRDLEGLPASEVAEVLGLTVEAVKSRLHRARVAVRERLAPMLGTEGLPAHALGPLPASAAGGRSPAPHLRARTERGAVTRAAGGGPRGEGTRAAGGGPGGEACPDVVEMFSRHLEGEISSDLCAQLEKHLESCGTCRARCDSLRATLFLCSQSGEGEEVPPRVASSVRGALRRFLSSQA